MKLVEIFVVGDAQGDKFSLLEKLAQFSMSYSGSNLLSDFDPLTGALCGGATSRAVGQTTLGPTAHGEPSLDVLSVEKQDGLVVRKWD